MFFKINKKPIKPNSNNPLGEKRDTCFAENHKISEKSKELPTIEEVPSSNNTNGELEASHPTITNSKIPFENVEKNLSYESLCKPDEIPSFDDDSLMSFENKNYLVKEIEAACYDENDEVSEEIPTFRDGLSFDNSDKNIISSVINKGNIAFNLKAFDLKYNSYIQISNNTNKFSNDELEASNSIKTKPKNVEKNLSYESLFKQDEIPSFDGDSLMSFENRMNHQKIYPVKEIEATCFDENDEEISSFNDNLLLSNSDKKISSSDINKRNNAFNLKAFDSNYDLNMSITNNSKIYSINELISNDLIKPTIINRHLPDSNNTIKPTVALEETTMKNNYLFEDNSLMSFAVGNFQNRDHKSLWENDEKNFHENNEFHKISKEMPLFNEEGSINISEENILLSIRHLVNSYSGQSNMPIANNANKFSIDELEASRPTITNSKITSENTEKNLSNEDLSKQDEIPSFDDINLMSFENKNYPVKEIEAACYDENDEVSEEIPTFRDGLSFDSSDKNIISSVINKGNNAFAIISNYNSYMPISNNTNKFSNHELEASNPIKNKSEMTSVNVAKNLSNEDLSKRDEIPSFDDSLMSFDNRNIFSIENKFLNSKLITTNKNSDSKDFVANDSNHANAKSAHCDFSAQIYAKNFKQKNISKSYNLELIGKQNSNSESTESNQEAISKNDMKTSDDITLFSLNDSFEDGRKSNRLDINSPFVPIRMDSPNKIGNTDEKSSRSIKDDSIKEKLLITENISFDNNTLNSFGEKSENDQFSRISKISSKNAVNLNNEKSSNSDRSYSRSKSLRFSKINIDKSKLKEFDYTCNPPLSNNKNEAHLEEYGINKIYKQNFKEFGDPVYSDISEASSPKSNATNNSSKNKLSISSGNKTVSKYDEIYQIKSLELNNPNIKNFNDPVFSNRSLPKVVSPQRLHASNKQGQVKPTIYPLNNLKKNNHIEEYENITPIICNPIIIKFDEPVFSNILQSKEASSHKSNTSNNASKTKPSISPDKNTVINTNTSHLVRYDIISPKLLNPNIKQFNDPVFSNVIQPKEALSIKKNSSHSAMKIKPPISRGNNKMINTNTTHLERHHINSPKLLNPNFKQFDDPVLSSVKQPKVVSPHGIQTFFNHNENNEIILDYSRKLRQQSDSLYNRFLDKPNISKNSNFKSKIEVLGGFDYYQKDPINEKPKQKFEEINSTQKYRSASLSRSNKRDSIQKQITLANPAYLVQRSNSVHRNSLKPGVKVCSNDAVCIFKDENILNNEQNRKASINAQLINTNEYLQKSKSLNYLSTKSKTSICPRDHKLIAKLKEVINYIEGEYLEVNYSAIKTMPQNHYHNLTYRKKNIKKIKEDVKMIGIEQVDPVEYAQKYASELINTSRMPDFGVEMWFESLKNVKPIFKEPGNVRHINSIALS